MVVAVFVAIALLFFLFSVYFYLGYRKEKTELKKQYKDWFQSEERKSYIVVLGDLYDNTELGKNLRVKLVQANIPLQSSEFLAIILLIGISLFVFLSILFKLSAISSLMIAIVLTILGYYLIFIIRKNKYMEMMNDQLAEVCRILANSTKAGMTIHQGIEVVAQEISSPASYEFKHLAHNLRLGVNFEKSLKELERRIGTKEYKLFVSSLLIQKKSGGNLTAVLYEMSRTLDERKILRQMVKTMTAEQRMISYILPIMPFILILAMNIVMDDFLNPLFTIPGAILSIIFLIGMTITFLLVRAVTNIKV